MRCKMCNHQIIWLMIMMLLTSQGNGMPQDLLVEPEPEPELDMLSCPRSCVCQYAAFNDLPIARWVNHMTSDFPEINDDFLLPTHTKLATCLLQAQSETLGLLADLPMDLQALILLHTGSRESQVTVNASSLRPLNQLTTLEIRGTGATLIMDEPLEFLQNANFEQIHLEASDRLQRPKYSKLPSDDYEYKPPSELLPTNELASKYPLQFEQDLATEILAYDQHVQRLKQTRMPSFYGWSRLEVLRIQDCHLDELHWQMFDGLGQLRHLSLERNGITELPPFAFTGAMHLKSLSLAHNSLGRLHYLGLAGLLELETLNLADNRLDRLSELSFPPLPKLLKADLRRNPIKYILPATFWVMNETRELQMGSEKASLELRTWNSYGQFDSLHKLRTLSLGNVSIASLEQGVFKGLDALEVLTLRGHISSIQFDAFSGLQQLKELDLSHCGIAELSMDALMGVQRLELLKLAYNNLTNIPPGLLDDQQQLEEVQLQGNQLKTLPSSFFRQPRLRVARLDQNPWQCSCQMSNWLPRLTNVERGPSVERCVKDINGEPISCRHVASFDMNKNLVPRCSNYNGRSVYYVQRRQLHCGAMEILPSVRRGSTRGLPHWRKVQWQQEKHTRQSRPKKRPHKAHSAQRNSLDFVLRHQQKQQPSLEGELSNEV